MERITSSRSLPAAYFGTPTKSAGSSVTSFLRSATTIARSRSIVARSSGDRQSDFSNGSRER